MTVRGGGGPARGVSTALSMVTAGLVAVAWTAGAHATHPGLPPLDLGTLETRPDSTLVVRGTDMGADQPVTLVLATMP